MVYRLDCCGEVAWVVAESASEAWKCARELAFCDESWCACDLHADSTTELDPDAEIAICYEDEDDARQDATAAGGEVEQVGRAWRVRAPAAGWKGTVTFGPALLARSVY